MAVQPNNLNPTSTRPLPRYPGGPREIMEGIQERPLEFLLEAVTQHGDALEFDLMVRRFVLLNSPEHVYHTLIANRANYVKKTRGYTALKLVLGNGLVTSEGDFWKRQRRIAQPAFHRRKLAGLGDVMTRCTEDTLERWRPMIGTGESLDVSAEMMALTLEIVCETLLGVRSRSGQAEQIAHAIDVGMEHIVKRTRSILNVPEFIPTPRNLRFKRAVKTLDDIVLGIIEERRRSPEARHHNDLLAMFMESRDAETGEQMDDEQLRDEVMTMFLAGHETTAMNLTWTLYLLSQHPQVLRRLQDELDDALGGRTPGFEDLARLPYLEMVLKESMRLYPPVPMLARTSVEDDVVPGGYRVPAESYVLICQYTTHRSASLWENPERFDPERFTEENLAKVPKWAWYPFSVGQRKCIGDGFAMMEARLVLATLLQEALPVLVPGHSVEFDVQVTLRPRHGMMMRLEPAR